MPKLGTYHKNATVLKQGEAVVKQEPRGDYGLEDYSLGDTVQYTLCQVGVNVQETVEYYRIRKPDWKNYSETCSPGVFNKYFSKQ